MYEYLVFVCAFVCCFLLAGHNKLATTAASSFQKHIRLFVCCIIIGKVAKGKLKCQQRSKSKASQSQNRSRNRIECGRATPLAIANGVKATLRRDKVESFSLSICLYLSVSLRQLLIALPSLVSCLLGRDVISITEKKLPPETKQYRVRNEASAEASAKSRLDAICLMLKLLITHTLRGSRNEQKL